jgi:hypothetical protein
VQVLLCPDCNAGSTAQLLDHGFMCLWLADLFPTQFPLQPFLSASTEQHGLPATCANVTLPVSNTIVIAITDKCHSDSDGMCCITQQ